MKKVISLIIILVLAFPTLGSITAFAQITQQLDEVTLQQIKEDLVAYLDFKEATVDNVTINYYGTLSDGSIMLTYSAPGLSTTTAVETFPLGDYIYTAATAANEITIYKDHTFTMLEIAYNSGMLNDKLVEEIAQSQSLKKFVTESEKSLGLSNKDLFHLKQSVGTHINSLADWSISGITVFNTQINSYSKLDDKNTLVGYSINLDNKKLSDKVTYNIGKYTYTTTLGDSVMLQNNTEYAIYTIKEAYDKKIISDSQLNAIAQKLGFVDVNTETQEINTNVTNTTANENNSNGAVPTGDNNIFSVGIIALCSAFAIMVIKRKRNKV